MTQVEKKVYKDLFFDLDHTLWDFETNSRETLKELYSLNKLGERGVEDFDVFFERYSYHNHKLWSRYSKGFIKQDELRWKRMWLALLDFKIADTELANTMAVQFLKILPYKTSLFPYCVEILEYLKQKNYRLHLITNGFNEVQHCKIQSCNIHHYFEEVITSERSNSLKPQKEIFEYAISVTGADKSSSIMIGDNLEADIEGALKAGLDTVFVNHLQITESAVHPTFIIHHLQELETLF